MPYSVFSDSLEVYESDWTPDLLDEFRARRGYDLTPHLPELAAGTTPEAADLRYDWGRTLAELVDEHYLTPLNAWARAHHTRFRSQSYGTPAVTLSSNALVDLPEGEGSQWRGAFSYTALGHVREPRVRAADHLVRNVDVAAFARLPRHAAGHEGRGRCVLPCRGSISLWATAGRIRRPRRRARLVVLRGRGFQRSQPVVDCDARRDAVSDAQ